MAADLPPEDCQALAAWCGNHRLDLACGITCDGWLGNGAWRCTCWCHATEETDAR